VSFVSIIETFAAAAASDPRKFVLIYLFDTCVNQRQQWTGSYYRPSTLKELGLIVQLGHHGGHCPFPGESRSDFTVVHTNGLHRVNVRFCGCSSSYGVSSRVQLLRVSWFPSSLDLPRTAFTFDCLDTFHLLNLQSKISAYDYYLSVVHITDNVGASEQKVCSVSSSSKATFLLIPIKYRYERFLYAIQIWRHLKMLERAGRGHDPAGVEATKFGECAVECPACPHPEKNLPDDWKSAPPEKR
jgi:CxC2 like cysteine cluster associated with KDZ transposases